MRRQSGQRRHRQRQGGIALLTVLFALLLISGIAFGMMYMANTETVINSNFRDLQKAQYGAWSGIHEARARMITTLTTGATNANAIARPTAFPSEGTAANMIYITNPASGETVDPHSGSYADTELCHEGFNGLSSLAPPGGTNWTAGAPCTVYPPTTPASFTTVNSNDPGRTYAYALPYKWVRITMKANASSGGDYLSAPFKVQPTSSSQTTPVCWNGYRQQLLPSGPATTCEAYVPTDPTTPYLTTVYVLTSLGVTPSGARRMVQMETAFNPPFLSNSAVASNDNVELNGALTVNGYDNCSCICYCTPHGGGTDYRVGPTGVCTQSNDTWNGCLQRPPATNCTSKWGIYAQGDIQNPTGANENIYASSNPAYSANNSNFPYNPAALVQAYSALPGVKNVTTAPYNWSCSSTGCGTHSQSSDPVGTFGTYPTIDPSQAGFDAYTSNPTTCPGPCSVFQITYIPGTSGGSTHLSGGWTGAGVLLVQGDLVIGGGLNFYGLIIVSGSITFTGSGSDPTNIYGSIVSGQPVVDSTTGGGGMNVHYDSCALANQFKGAPPTILASRELPY
jgi:hypothetical protein